MKRTDSFVYDFKMIQFEITSNIDDKYMKSIIPVRQKKFYGLFQKYDTIEPNRDLSLKWNDLKRFHIVIQDCIPHYEGEVN